VQDDQDLRYSLQEAMSFLAAIASGLEEALGEPANTVSNIAGKKLGSQFAAGHTNDDLLAALAEVQQILRENGCLWQFEPFKPKNQNEMVEQTPDGQSLQLVFRDCMIRQALFRFGHHQKGSLCNLMNGFFAAALEHIMGRQSQLEIVHAGENACLKRLTVLNTTANQTAAPLTCEAEGRSKS
jgi:predicted hydrocarbon binding protein